MRLKIVKAGLMTTVQDLGRYGYQKYGVPVGGAMDEFALRTANILTGNDENSPVLEMTLSGPVIAFQQDALIAVCGGDLSPSIDGISLPMWRPVWIKQGSVLSFGRAVHGCRAYLAVAGGFALPPVMDSCSTNLQAAFGGYEGRALRDGDELPAGEPSPLAKKWMNLLREFAEQSRGKAGASAEQDMEKAGVYLDRVREKACEYADQQKEKKSAFADQQNKKGGPFDSGKMRSVSWEVSRMFRPRYALTGKAVVRVFAGREFSLFDPAAREAFFQFPFTVLPQSDRMGYRLQGPVLKKGEFTEMISETVTMGTVQVPPDGQPLILMADRQTTGGYPRIAQAAAVDLPVLAQLKPGDTVQFQEISFAEAEALLLAREESMRLMKQAVKMVMERMRSDVLD